MNLIYEFLYFGSFLCFPFFTGVLFLVWKRRLNRWIAAFFLLFTLFFIYCRFVEPQMLIVREEVSPVGARFVLFSDPHLGTYKGASFMKRTVEKIKGLEPDFVLLAGDWVYAIDPETIPTLFAPLQDLGIPLYAVMGNHDFLPAGELTQEEGTFLIETLESYGVTFIDNLITEEQGLQIVGLGELWNKETDIEVLKDVNPAIPSLVLTHNPDVSYLLDLSQSTLLLAGHTHGGQVRIPFLYKSVIPTKYDWGTGRGWFKVNGGSVYVTSGTGETGLPLRLGVPPELVLFAPSENPAKLTP